MPSTGNSDYVMQKQQWEIERLRQIIKGALKQLEGIEGFRCHTRTPPCAANRISAARVLLDTAEEKSK